MVKEIHLRIDVELNDSLENYRIENDLDSKQDAIKILLNDDLKNKKSFVYRLKNLFKF